MAKPNYQFEKRQKELAKKAKKLEKQQRKAGLAEGADTEADVEEGAESDTTDTAALPTHESGKVE